MAEKIYLADKPTLDSVQVDTVDTRNKVTMIANNNGLMLGSDGNYYRNVFVKPKVNKAAIAGGSSSNANTFQSIAVSKSYVFGGLPGKIDVFDKKELTLITSLTTQSSNVTELCIDENYVYAACYTVLYKYSLADFSLVATANNKVHKFDIDDDFIYIGGFSNAPIIKCRKSDMSEVAQSAVIGDRIEAVKVKGDFVYVTDKDGYIRKLNKDDLNTVLEIRPSTSSIYLDIDRECLYAGLGSTLKTYFLNNLSEKKSVNIGMSIQTVKIDGSNVYVGGKSGELRKYDRELNLIGLYDSITSTVYIANDSNYLFATGSANIRIYDDPLEMKGYERK